MVHEFLATSLPVVQKIRFGHPFAVANDDDDDLPELDFGSFVTVDYVRICGVLVAALAVLTNLEDALVQLRVPHQGLPDPPP